MTRHHVLLAVPSVLLLAFLASPLVASAQLNGPNIKGDAGLKAGSQPPPGGYVVVPLYFYSADDLKDSDGTVIAKGHLGAQVYGVGVNYVTTKKLGGANYGFMVVLPFANNRIQGGRIDQNPGAGLTDMYVQPVNLGWFFRRADVTAAYGLYLPTGRYQDGANDNTGLGMWGHELLAGVTVYLDAQRTWHAATTATVDFLSEKKDSTVKVGNILNLEGGVGRDFFKGACRSGWPTTPPTSSPATNSIRWPPYWSTGRTGSTALAPKPPSLSPHERPSTVS